MTKQGLIFLNLLNFSPNKNQSILSALKDPDRIFVAAKAYLEKIPYLSAKEIDEIITRRESNELEKELKLIEKEKIKIIDIFDKDYPVLLKEIFSPPLVIYVKGNTRVLNNNNLFAIVGSRIPTAYGISMADKFAGELASLGLGIVSGLAKGIDTAAHKSAVKNGYTIAVLGSGLQNIYPKENTRLAEMISEKGAVISEFPLRTSPAKENFPRRNRIISGLCRGILVAEAAERSGALITARLACEQNREVFALPGKANSSVSKGTHLLIKEGAKLVDSIQDILEELN